MASNFIQEGHVCDWTNTTGATVVSGAVVVAGTLLGVALLDISVGAVGAVRVTGVFRVPKVSAAVIAQGARVHWDVSAGAFDAATAVAAEGDVTGDGAVAWEAAGNGLTSLLVRFTGVPGTVTPAAP